MATYGPGDSSLDHADDEHIVLSDYMRGIDVLTVAISELADLPRRAEDGAAVRTVDSTAGGPAGGTADIRLPERSLR
jgi:LysW-gamma-L-lysine carboxypeptidase